MLFPRSRFHRALTYSTIALASTAIGSTVNAHEAPQVTSTADATTALATMACPIIGDSSFSDSWGDARSGGRRHEGVDMAAEYGTPIAATLAGFVEFKSTRAGGKSVWLTTADGDKFFYAHLDQWEGESRDVERGEVIGYVGSTGNAGGPHLHFEVRPGGVAINPYPSTARACAPQPEPARQGLTLLVR